MPARSEANAADSIRRLLCFGVLPLGGQALSGEIAGPELHVDDHKKGHITDTISLSATFRECNVVSSSAAVLGASQSHISHHITSYQEEEDSHPGVSRRMGKGCPIGIAHPQMLHSHVNQPHPCVPEPTAGTAAAPPLLPPHAPEPLQERSSSSPIHLRFSWSLLRCQSFSVTLLGRSEHLLPPDCTPTTDKETMSPSLP